MNRTIMHLDMNAFFASVEQQDNPDLRGKPIAVAGSGKRTVITTASYEARAFGVKTAMSVQEGKRLCPGLIVVTGDTRKYARVSREIVALMRRFTPLVEVFSIDEAFLDLTASLDMFSGAETIARLLKELIRDQLGLSCSVGIAPNKLLAKLASDMQKPDGLVMIRPEEVAQVLEKVPVTDLCGIGPKTGRQLALYGIRSCGDLGRFPEEILVRRFGRLGARLAEMGRGIDDSPVVAEEDAEEVKSVGHSMTLERDVDDHEEILRRLLELSEMVARRARRYGIRGKTVSLSIRYADFNTKEGKQQTLPNPTSDTAEIYRTARSILDTITLPQPVRLLGISLSNLRHEEQAELNLFPEERRCDHLGAAMDRINDRYGDYTVTFGTLTGAKRRGKGGGVISPAWKPEGVRSTGEE